MTADPPAPAADPPAADTPAADPPKAEDPPAADPPAPEPPKPGEPDFVPTGEAAYALEIPEALKPLIPQGAEDPAVQAVTAGFKEAGLTQRELNAAFKALEVLGAKGLLQPPFDPAAETAALNVNGQDGTGGARQLEQETFLRSLHDRGEITPESFGELMTLVPTAKGIVALEQMRKAMTDPTKTPGADGDAAAADAKARTQQEAKDLLRDPKYGRDKDFTKAADAKFKSAFD